MIRGSTNPSISGYLAAGCSGQSQTLVTGSIDLLLYPFLTSLHLIFLSLMELKEIRRSLVTESWSAFKEMGPGANRRINSSLLSLEECWRNSGGSLLPHLKGLPLSL